MLTAGEAVIFLLTVLLIVGLNHLGLLVSLFGRVNRRTPTPRTERPERKARTQPVEGRD